MSTKIHVNDIGTEIKVTVHEKGVILDISGATIKRIILTHEDRIFDKPAVFDSDGVDGVLKYVSISGDFYTAGIWEKQAFVKLPAKSFHTDIEEFTVTENL